MLMKREWAKRIDYHMLVFSYKITLLLVIQYFFAKAYMNIQSAKGISIDELLLKLGYQPTKEQGGRKWYHSPLRNENHPSFVVSKDARAWFDHGEGVGGNILDLAKRLGNCLDLPATLAYLQELISHTDIVSINSQSSPLPIHLPAYRLIRANDFQIYTTSNQYTPSAAYLMSRGIDPQAVAHYVRDVVFNSVTDPQRELQGIGLPNQAGGYEVRARSHGTYFKTSVGIKDFSFFRASQQDQTNTRLHIFEGAPDFYTYLTCYKTKDPREENFLILNGTGLVARALEFLHDHLFGLTMVWNQNDPAGDKMVERLMSLPQRVGTINHLYEGFKDYNAWHMEAIKPEQAIPTSLPPSRLKTTPKIDS